jgi:hypothetical protein
LTLLLVPAVVVTVTPWLPPGALEATWKLPYITVSDQKLPEPLNEKVILLPAFTVLEPWLSPNPLPDIVTVVLAPISPRDGEMLVMLGVTLPVALA